MVHQTSEEHKVQLRNQTQLSKQNKQQEILAKEYTYKLHTFINPIDFNIRCAYLRLDKNTHTLAKWNGPISRCSSTTYKIHTFISS